MSIWCGGCVRETGGETAIYRLDVKDGAVASLAEKRSNGDSQPNCYVCRECWEKVPADMRMTESRVLAMANIVGEDHVFAFARTYSDESPVFVHPNAVNLIGGRIKAVIDDMHRRQVEFARQQALCDAGACECAKQEKPWPHFEGAIGLRRGTKITFTLREHGDELKTVRGVVLCHDHPPLAHWHTVRRDDNDVWPTISVSEVHEVAS